MTDGIPWRNLLLAAHLIAATIWTGGHIVPVTVLSVLFVLTGVSFRTGWLVW